MNDEGNSLTLLKSFGAAVSAVKLPVARGMATIRTFNLNGSSVITLRVPTVGGKVLVLLPPYGYAVVENELQPATLPVTKQAAVSAP